MATLQCGQASALGTITCYDCDAEFSSELINGCWIRCGSCDSFRGYNISGLECTCGNDVFMMTKARAYCPDCGSDSRWEELKTPLHRT